MIPILEFSSTKHRDIRPGYPVPGMIIPGWHCSICGEKVSSSHGACHMHEVGPQDVSGTFCALDDSKIPDRAQDIQFLLDNMIITLKCAIIRPARGMKSPKIVSLEPVNTQYKRMYYAFEASGIEYSVGENNERSI